MFFMKFCSTSAFALAALIALPMMAHAGPKGAQTLQYKQSGQQAGGSVSAGNIDYSFIAQSYIDFDGTRAGFVYVESADYFGGTGVQSIQCRGPEFANAVTVNQSTGNSSVNAVLDPANPNCFTSFLYGAGAIALRVIGQSDGTDRYSESGTITQTSGTSVFKQNYQGDDIYSTSTGSNGFYTGTFTGRVQSFRSTNRTQIK
jgi:hypothetical protein